MQYKAHVILSRYHGKGGNSKRLPHITKTYMYVERTSNMNHFSSVAISDDIHIE